LHYPLPNAQIDNKDIFNAPSLFEYDVIIFHPLGFEQSVLNLLEEREDFYSSSGEKIILGNSSNNALNINQLLEQRCDEMQKFLAMNGLLIIYAVPEMDILELKKQPTETKKNFISKLFLKLFSRPSSQHYPDEQEDLFKTSRYFLFDNLDYYKVNYCDLMTAGTGITDMPEDDFDLFDKSLFQNVLLKQSKNIAFRAYFNKNILDGHSNISILLSTKRSRIPLSILVKRENGRIVFLPNFAQSDTDDAMREAKFLVDDIEIIMNAEK